MSFAPLLRAKAAYYQGAVMSIFNKLKPNKSLKRQFLSAGILCSAIILSACGFHLPNQAKLDKTIPEINVIGDYHSDFYKMVVTRLKANGVTVNAQSSDFYPKVNQEITTLMIPEPTITDNVVSVNSRAQSIESAIVVSVAATLSVPNHRPIVMRNSTTRSVLNKPGHSLASDVEKEFVVKETQGQLADALVLRLGYLGRSSDPDAVAPQPGELVLTDEENIQLTNQRAGMTLLEALQAQDSYESATAPSVTLDELNNGTQILDKEYQLPKVKVERLHKAPNIRY